jgi:hypothetical protein
MSKKLSRMRNKEKEVEKTKTEKLERKKEWIKLRKRK